MAGRVGVADDHGAHAAAEAGERDHDDVDDEEEHECAGDEEMESSRGLPAAESDDGEWNRGIEGGGHGQAGPDDQRKEDKDDGQIGDALDHIVAVRAVWIRRRAMEISCDHMPKGTQVAVAGRGCDIFAEMAVPEAGEAVDEAGEDG